MFFLCLKYIHYHLSEIINDFDLHNIIHYIVFDIQINKAQSGILYNWNCITLLHYYFYWIIHALASDISKFHIMKYKILKTPYAQNNKTLLYTTNLILASFKHNAIQVLLLFKSKSTKISNYETNICQLQSSNQKVQITELHFFFKESCNRYSILDSLLNYSSCFHFIISSEIFCQSVWDIMTISH